jgi:hypothetical protein
MSGEQSQFFHNWQKMLSTHLNRLNRDISLSLGNLGPQYITKQQILSLAIQNRKDSPQKKESYRMEKPLPSDSPRLVSTAHLNGRTTFYEPEAYLMNFPYHCLFLNFSVKKGLYKWGE